MMTRRLQSLLGNLLASEWTIRTIDDAFEGADVPLGTPQDSPTGARRARLAEYIAGTDWSKPKEVRRFLNGLEVILQDEDRKHELVVSYRRPAWSDPIPEPPHPAARIFEELARCGYEWNEGHIRAVSPSARLADAKAHATAFDLSHMGEHIDRIERSIEADPAAAIGSAKELVETVAKTLLNKRGIPFAPGDDVLALGKAVFKMLKHVPDDIPDAAKGAASIKRTLSNLATVVQGIAELRGLYGTGHGKDGKAKGLQPRHAKLVVGAAATLAFYWVETENEQT